MEVSTNTACLCVVGAALAAGVYILWGPENIFKRRGNILQDYNPIRVWKLIFPTTYRSMCGPAECREHLLRKCCVTGIKGTHSVTVQYVSFYVLQALASVGCVLKWLESVHGGRFNKALLHILQSEPSF